jgi:hypothetical protein
MLPVKAAPISAPDLEKFPASADAGGVAPGLALVGLIGLAVGCAHAADPSRPHHPRELVLAYDDNRATAGLTFPSVTYESIIRFDLPDGKHDPIDLRLMAESVGTIAITFYDNTVLESPGEPISMLTREFVPEDVSNGKDGRWVVEDLRHLPALSGTVWIGLRKLAGTPSIWTAAVVSGQTYLRDRDPSRAIGLLPVKRTPMLRLGLLP